MKQIPIVVFILVLIFSCGDTGAGGSGSGDTTGDTTWDDAIENKVLADDGAASDGFGRVLSLSGETFIVGAEGNDDKGSSSGSAYIYSTSGGSATQLTKLVPTDGAAGDYFGCAVSVSGNIAIIGAYGNDDNGSNAGTVYAAANINNTWVLSSEKQYPDNAAASARYGYAVSLEGFSCCLIGAPGDSTNEGAAYFYEGEEEQKVTASDGSSGNLFGSSVSVDGETAIIGAYGDTSETGKAYIFTYNSAADPHWSQTAILTASDGGTGDYFGESVCISGDTAIAGAKYYMDENLREIGAAYIFTRNSDTGVWSQTQQLFADDAGGGHSFGSSVAISGNTAVIGATGDTNGSGSAYIFTRQTESGDWTLTKKLTASDRADSDWYGTSLAISDDAIIVGASYEDEKGTNAGAAYLYSK